MALKAIELYREPFQNKNKLSIRFLSFYQAEKSLEQTSRKENKTNVSSSNSMALKAIELYQ
jgi:hypothetical protein